MPRTRTVPAVVFRAFAVLSWITVASTVVVAREELLKARVAQNLGPISALTIVAKSKGIFERHGLDITVSNFTSGKQCLNTVIGGGAESQPRQRRRLPLPPWPTSRSPSWPAWNIPISRQSPAKAGIKTKADLRGKKIGFTAGTGSEVYTATLLKSAGLTPADVKLVNLRPQEMLPALAAGSIDAFDTWEPHIANAKKALGEAVVELDTKGTYSETFNIVVMRAYLNANPALVGKFIAALIDAETWIKANPDDAITTVAKAVGMKRDDLKAIWSDYVYRVRLDDRLLEILKTHAAWRLSSGNHPPGAVMPDFSKVIAPAPLKSIDPARVTISMK